VPGDMAFTCKMSMSMSKTFIGGAVCREFESEAQMLFCFTIIHNYIIQTYNKHLYYVIVSIALMNLNNDRWFDGRLPIQWRIAATDDSKSISTVSTGICFHSCYVCSRRVVLRCMLVVQMKMMVVSE